MGVSIKKLIIGILCVCLIFSVGCSKQANDQEKTVIKINSENISLKEGIFYLRLTERQFEDRGNKDIWETPFDGRSAEDVAKEVALKSVIKSNVLSQSSSVVSIDLSEKDNQIIKTYSKNMLETIGAQVLEGDQITLEDIEVYIRKLYLSSLVNQKLAEPFFEGMKDQRDLTKEVEEMLQQKVKESRVLTITTLKLDEDNVDIAGLKKDIKAQILEGSDFDNLVNKYGNAKTVETKVIRPTDTELPYDETIFDSVINELDLVALDEGYEVILIADKKELSDQEIKDIRINLEKTLNDQLVIRSQELAYDGLLQKAKVEIDDLVWAQVRVKSKE